MNFPSFVRFFSGGRERADRREPREALRFGGPYGEGREEVEVRAWACWSPRGSLRLWAEESKMTEPTEL